MTETPHPPPNPPRAASRERGVAILLVVMVLGLASGLGVLALRAIVLQSRSSGYIRDGLLAERVATFGASAHDGRLSQYGAVQYNDTCGTRQCVRVIPSDIASDVRGRFPTSIALSAADDGLLGRLNVGLTAQALQGQFEVQTMSADTQGVTSGGNAGTTGGNTTPVQTMRRTVIARVGPGNLSVCNTSLNAMMVRRTLRSYVRQE